MNLFTVKGDLSIDTSNVYVDNQKIDLSVQNIKYSDYVNLVKNKECLSNVLYVVESDYINAYNQQIKNVAEPIDDNDAVTLKYMKDSINNITIDDSIFVKKDELNDLIKQSLIDIINN